MAATYVKNTFIELDADVDEDSAFAPSGGFGRQCTDSVLVTRHKRADKALDKIVEVPTVDTLPTLDVEELSSEDEVPEAPLPMQRAREIAQSGGGLSGLTTAMLRNVPKRYSEKGLATELNRSGYAGKYDFFFLPLDLRSKRNRGFAFVNFSEAKVAQRFYDQYHGRFLRNFQEPGSEPLLILPADVQGFEANALRVRAGAPGAPQLGVYPDHLGAGGQMAFQAVPFQASSSELPPWPFACAGTGQMQPPESQGQMRPMAQRFCVNCGGQLNGDFHFCPYCGCQKAHLN